MKQQQQQQQLLLAVPVNCLLLTNFFLRTELVLLCCVVLYLALASESKSCNLSPCHNAKIHREKKSKTEARDAKVAFAWRLAKCFQIGLTTLQLESKTQKLKERNEMHFHSKCRHGKLAA